MDVNKPTLKVIGVLIILMVLIGVGSDISFHIGLFFYLYGKYVAVVIFVGVIGYYVVQEKRRSTPARNNDDNILTEEDGRRE